MNAVAEEIPMPAVQRITPEGFRFVPDAQFESDIASGRTLILRHIYGKTGGMYTARPARARETGMLLTGQKNFSPEEARKQILVVDANTRLTLKDGFPVNLSNEVMRIHWGWLSLCGVIAYSEDIARSNMYPDVMFFVENEEQVVEARVMKRELRNKAMNLIDQSSQAKWRTVMRLMGDDGTEYTKPQILDYLQNAAEADPQKVINHFNDPDQDTKTFFYQLKDARPKILTTTAEGIIKYGNITLGLNEPMAIEFLKKESNADIVRGMYSQILSKKKVEKSETILAIEADQRKQLADEEMEAEIQRRVEERLAKQLPENPAAIARKTEIDPAGEPPIEKPKNPANGQFQKKNENPGLQPPAK